MLPVTLRPIGHEMSEQQQIENSRQEIDRLDDEILRLLNERSQHVITIGKAKRQADPTALLHTPGREAAIVERLSSQNSGPFPNDAIRPVYREIMSASLSLEGLQTVAYLGPPATFTHLAALGKFGESAKYVPVSGIKEVFDEVERGRALYGVVPIENSTEGVVNYTLDMFIDSNLMIYGEVQQEISHHLMSTANTLDSVKTIYSHPHALAQCRNWLESHVPNIGIRETPSTAGAAEKCAAESDSAAIASELAAQMYGLNILKSKIEAFHAKASTKFTPPLCRTPLRQKAGRLRSLSRMSNEDSGFDVIISCFDTSSDGSFAFVSLVVT
jgi:chorismate mutase/prephenate dehydratase